MFKGYKAESSLSYLIAIIFIIIIFTTIGTNVSSMIEKNKERKYVSVSVKDISANEGKNISEAQLKRNMVKFYEINNGKYVKWTLKVAEVNEFFDTVKCPVNIDGVVYNELFIKCKFEKGIAGKIKKGDEITVSGQVIGYSEFYKAIELKHCRVENIK
ncbi:hypothetical protein [Haloimpatiens lingqiaonensis]|uniref:hypothetical protein n=1 Tax=Haloimpatiens lingqiaonensis TaxID=1380675 RepID=UPI0010FEF4F7|nr:hypothetical protein [Haloimpatiens lingqiaonensis]